MVISSSTKLNILVSWIKPNLQYYHHQGPGEVQRSWRNCDNYQSNVSQDTIGSPSYKVLPPQKKRERREISNIKTEQHLELPNCLLNYGLVITSCVICFYKNRICKISITTKEKLQLQSFRIVYRWQVDIFEILERPFITICDLYQETLIIFPQLIQQTITENWLTRSSPPQKVLHYSSWHKAKSHVLLLYYKKQSNIMLEYSSA